MDLRNQACAQSLHYWFDQLRCIASSARLSYLLNRVNQAILQNLRDHCR